MCAEVICGKIGHFYRDFYFAFRAVKSTVVVYAMNVVSNPL